MNLKRLLCAGLVALSLGIVNVATNKPNTTVQAYSISKRYGTLRFTNKYGTMEIDNIRVFKIYDEMDIHPLQYTYFINGRYKNMGPHKRSPLSFYNRYFYEEEYYKGKYWMLNGGSDLVPSHYYDHKRELAQTKIPKHGSTEFAIATSLIPPLKMHNNELFRVSVTPYESDYVAAHQYFTTGYMHYRHFSANNDYDPNIAGSKGDY